ncbi:MULTISPECIES: CidA/LrgA family protein [Tenebrionibacter/Tenebrionicola group]|jgi:holin-like protein|uniref:CidA/LrgA family protein n=2 Tax=Tenebrionibacter/Tenebrionicola group TaxID=2969848 RepID=A0A8K0V872_9ENTR|nr:MULTISPECIES: CidA/LrgA family protein [Tenebrionibacter/Tenebrionicola group]MBK4715960.1 CidA/LrgA family protein [Tenebrionibacter intestinalis]MBV5096858.1 CidA/LrgA family protein [Tenebrionicola larvae]
MKLFLITGLQLIIYIVIFIIAGQLVDYFSIPLPANIIGMLLLFIMIITGLLPVKFVKQGATFLLSEMLLFFVPAVVAIINYFDILEKEGIRIIAVIALSTIIVLATTAWVVDKLYNYELKKAVK